MKRRLACGSRIISIPNGQNLRFIEGEPSLAAVGDAEPARAALRRHRPDQQGDLFRGRQEVCVGNRIRPAGWAKFFALPAADFADRFVDGAVHPAFAACVPLVAKLRQANDVEAAARMIDDHVAELLAGAPRDDLGDPRCACMVLVEDELTSVAELAEKLGMP